MYLLGEDNSETYVFEQQSLKRWLRVTNCKTQEKLENAKIKTS